MDDRVGTLKRSYHRPGIPGTYGQLTERSMTAPTLIISGLLNLAGSAAVLVEEIATSHGNRLASGAVYGGDRGSCNRTRRGAAGKRRSERRATPLTDWPLATIPKKADLEDG